MSAGNLHGWHGVVIEGLQYLISYRTAEIEDALAIAFGLGIGWLLYLTPFGRIIPALDRMFAGIRQLPDS